MVKKKTDEDEAIDRIKEGFRMGAVEDEGADDVLLLDPVLQEIGPQPATEEGSMVSSLVNRRQCGYSKRCPPAE